MDVIFSAYILENKCMYYFLTVGVVEFILSSNEFLHFIKTFREELPQGTQLLRAKCKCGDCCNDVFLNVL
jgi:hypothetical protein